MISTGSEQQRRDLRHQLTHFDTAVFNQTPFSRQTLAMQKSFEIISQLGQFAGLVIVVCVVVMLVVSLLDRHPRSKQSKSEASRNDASAGDVKKLP